MGHAEERPDVLARGEDREALVGGELPKPPGKAGPNRWREPGTDRPARGTVGSP
jgi:hypothetical protein